MMIQPERLFTNFFSDISIIPTRLLNFGTDLKNSLIENNPDDVFKVLITQLSDALQKLSDEIGSIDTNINIQVGKTDIVDKVIELFGEAMSVNEGIIAKAVGGFHSAAFLQFYPHGLTEYTSATKTTITTLLKRVTTAANTFSAKLGTELTNELLAFEKDYITARDEQLKQMSSVGTDRTDRGSARTQTELLLLQAIFQVGNRFPGDVRRCLSYFNFNLLYKQTQHKHQNIPGTLAAQQTQTILNRTLTDNVKIIFTNTSTNASAIIWLGATPTKEAGIDSIEVQPGHSVEIKPSQLGNLSYTFLLVKNLSEVNELTFNVEVIG